MQDEVKVQWQPPGETAVYRFLNQQGAMIFQVPPQEVLNLAVEISQELAKEASSKTPAVTGGNHHGR